MTASDFYKRPNQETRCPKVNFVVKFGFTVTREVKKQDKHQRYVQQIQCKAVHNMERMGIQISAYDAKNLCE